MSKRPLSNTPSAVRARERRLDAWIRKAEAEFHAEVTAHMTRGLTFDEAYVAAGGAIYSDEDLATMRLVATLAKAPA